MRYPLFPQMSLIISTYPNDRLTRPLHKPLNRQEFTISKTNRVKTMNRINHFSGRESHTSQHPRLRGMQMDDIGVIFPINLQEIDNRENIIQGRQRSFQMFTLNLLYLRPQYRPHLTITLTCCDNYLMTNFN